ncbi:MAG: LysR family transcriptional regulator [Pseudorhodoplanes sp.]|uniref:LysR family transcriptional regulator n=1 Tax=Pseudorhodoplanes sp. TaxID=1934341 RepID=UPI003D10A5BA
MKATHTIDWDDLRIFLAVARTGSISQTARSLRLDHSTVSRRISKLEVSLGHSLFARGRDGFRLNELGERLLARTEAVESAVISIHAEVGSKSDALATGIVRVATMEGIASLYLARQLTHLRRSAPNLVIELVTSAQVIHVNRREADIFLSFFKPSGQGLISEKIGHFPLYLFASPDYLAGHGTPRSERELRDHVFVTYIEDLIQLDAVRWLYDVIRDCTVVFRSNSMISQMSAAASGMGIVMLPSFAVNDETSLVRVMGDTLSTRREIWLSIHADLQFVPRIKTVVTFLKRRIAEDIAAGRL